jgi:MFS family permease
MMKAGALGRMLAAFQTRWYRWLWAARLLSATAFRMRGVVRGWLIYNLTGSALALSAVNASWGVGTFLFSAPGGAMSDRFDRRKVMVLGQAACAAVFLSVALLIFSGAIRVWHLAVSSFLFALAFSLVIPARMALLSDLMPREALLNAMALSMVGMGLMGVLASTVGGVLLEQLGAGPVYVLMGLLYGGTVGIYLRIPSPEQGGTARRASIRADLVEGGRYVRADPELMAMLSLEVARVLLFMPYMGLLPVFAADVFNSGAVGLGLLQGASSLGRMLGSLIIASLGDIRRKGLLLLGSGMLAGGGLILLGQARSLVAALVALLLTTTVASAYMVTRSTLIQTTVPPRMRGRMAGFNHLIFGLMPVGSLPAGALADAVGAPFTVTLLGVVLLGVFLTVAVLQPRLRSLQ